MVAERELGTAEPDADAVGARSEPRRMQRAVDPRVRDHPGVGKMPPAGTLECDGQHVASVHDEPARAPPVAIVEANVLDRLREAPDPPPGLAREALVDGQLPDPGREAVPDQVERGAEPWDAGALVPAPDEERERDLV